jgi:hypothetical protein
MQNKLKGIVRDAMVEIIQNKRANLYLKCEATRLLMAVSPNCYPTESLMNHVTPAGVTAKLNEAKDRLKEQVTHEQARRRKNNRKYYIERTIAKRKAASQASVNNTGDTLNEDN